MSTSSRAMPADDGWLPNVDNFQHNFDLSAADTAFLARVRSTPRHAYIRFLETAGIASKRDVLDAGCGFGQWSRALSELNRRVTGVDIDRKRLHAAEALTDTTCFPNLGFIAGNLEQLPFDSGRFDAVFCYSVIYTTNVPKVLHEFRRVLRDGGALFVNTNDIGWYLKNLIGSHNPAPGFSPRWMAAKTLVNSFIHFAFGNRISGSNVVMPQASFYRELSRNGFDVIEMASDPNVGSDGENLFLPTTWCGLVASYNTLCTVR